METRILIAAAALLGSTGAIAAVTNADFYCRELMKTPAMYYEMALKNCGDGKAPELQQGVCVQTVDCAFITDAVKERSQKVFQKAFSDLAEDDKKRLIKEDDSLEWVPANLTCKGTKNEYGSICPMPEECKGDLFFKMQPALVSMDKLKAASDRRDRGNGRIFQNGSGAGK